jgi:hypothetical protein
LQTAQELLFIVIVAGLDPDLDVWIMSACAVVHGTLSRSRPRLEYQQPIYVKVRLCAAILYGIAQTPGEDGLLPG